MRGARHLFEIPPATQTSQMKHCSPVMIGTPERLQARKRVSLLGNPNQTCLEPRPMPTELPGVLQRELRLYRAGGRVTTRQRARALRALTGRGAGTCTCIRTCTCACSAYISSGYTANSSSGSSSNFILSRAYAASAWLCTRQQNHLRRAAPAAGPSPTSAQQAARRSAAGSAWR